MLKGFYFLEAEDIWIFRFYSFKEAFLKHGSDTVNISWDYFHCLLENKKSKSQIFYFSNTDLQSLQPKFLDHYG